MLYPLNFLPTPLGIPGVLVVRLSRPQAEAKLLKRPATIHFYKAYLGARRRLGVYV